MSHGEQGIFVVPLRCYYACDCSSRSLGGKKKRKEGRERENFSIACRREQGKHKGSSGKLEEEEEEEGWVVEEQKGKKEGGGFSSL